MLAGGRSVEGADGARDRGRERVHGRRALEEAQHAGGGEDAQGDQDDRVRGCRRRRSVMMIRGMLFSVIETCCIADAIYTYTCYAG